MEIKTIPSKQIYEMQNQKVRKNKVEKLEVVAKNIKINKDFNALAYSQTNDTTDVFPSDDIVFNTNADDFTEVVPFFKSHNQTKFSSYSYYSLAYYAYASVSCYRSFGERFTFYIPKRNGKKYIDKLLEGHNKQGDSYTQYSVTYSHQKADIVYVAAKTTAGTTDTTESTSRYEISSILADISNDDDDWETVTGDLPSTAIRVSYKPSDTAKAVISEIPEYARDNLIDVHFASSDDYPYYVCTIWFLCGFMNLSAYIPNQGQTGSYPEFISKWYGQQSDRYDSYGNETGYINIYKPLKIQISFYGNVLELDVQEEKLTFGDASSNNLFTIESNEILQNPVPSDDFLKLVEKYKNGKETATIRCSIPETLSVYNIGDEVVPMVYGEDGADRPMSRYRDGTEKVFKVVGTKFIYDGAVWQELTLQEKAKES